MTDSTHNSPGELDSLEQQMAPDIRRLRVGDHPTAADRVWRTIEARVDVATPILRSSRRSSRRWLVGAGLTVATLIIGIIATQFTTTRSPSAVATTAYVTGGDTVATFRLPDGSRVTLAPRSKLTMTYGVKQPRVVVLDGEAYFDVIEASVSPFVVRTGAVATRVVGTAFDVRSYPERHRRARVSVATGKVTMARMDSTGHARPIATLGAGMSGTVGDSGTTVVSSNDREPTIRWVEGAVVLHDAPLPEVLEMIGQWYGMALRTSDPVMSQWHVSGTFDVGNRAQTLSSLRQLLNVDMTFDDTSRQSSHMLRATLSRRARQHVPAPRIDDGRSPSGTPREVGR